MTSIRKIVSRVAFLYLSICTLILASRNTDDSLKPQKPQATLEEQARNLTQQIKLSGLSTELEEKATEVSKAISTKRRGSNDSFYMPSPYETMELFKLRQAMNQAKR